MTIDEKNSLAITPVPALVAVLLNLEKRKGSPLTESEVLDARDSAACIAMPWDVHASIAEARGYEDINPEHAWEDWLAIRPALYADETQHDVYPALHQRKPLGC